MNAPTYIQRTPRRRRKAKGLGLPLAVLVALLAALAALLVAWPANDNKAGAQEVEPGIVITSPELNAPRGAAHPWAAAVNGTVVIRAEVTEGPYETLQEVVIRYWPTDYEQDAVVLATLPKGTGGPYQVEWNTTQYDDNQFGQITAKAVWAEGYSSEDYRNVLVDNTEPVVQINRVVEGIIADEAIAEYTIAEDTVYNYDNALAVERQVDGGMPEQITYNPDAGADTTTMSGLSPGEHTVLIRATDTSGNFGEDFVTFKVHKPYEWGNYEEYQGHSYASVYEPLVPGMPLTGMAWDDAEEAALSEGEVYGETAHLVTINSKAEREWLATTFATDGEMWIGLSKSGSWGWFSDEPLTYTYWAPGEPQASDSFATMSRAGVGPGRWTGRGAQPSDSSLTLPALVEFYVAPYGTDFGPTDNATLTARPWVKWNESVSGVEATLERQTASGAWAPVAIRPLRYEGSTNTSVMTPAKRLRPASYYKVNFTAEDADGIVGHVEWEFGTR
jgi:hypothetical protein